MTPETRRILNAWLRSGRPLGKFLNGVVIFSAKWLCDMSDADLASASERYLDWLQDMGLAHERP